MSRLLYTLASYLLAMVAPFHLWRRGRKLPAYREHIGERYGFYPARVDARPLIWIHAVSVGETRAAEPLIAALRAAYPGHAMLLTHMTPTGRATEGTLLADCARCYLPYDMPGAVRRFLRHYRPVLGLVMETEIWPNLVAACHQQNMPLLLVNARLSARSAHRYQRFAALTRHTLGQLHAVLAQGAEDAARFEALGARGVVVMGNLKFDRPLSLALQAEGQGWRAAQPRPVVLAASTREGEEALLLSAWQAQHPAALLVLVPRHPQRFADVAALASAQGLRVSLRSQGAPDAGVDVWVGDSMGEMGAYYAMADVVIMGGSLLDYGSQNLIEACAAGVPVILGPSTHNFAEASAEALRLGAAQSVFDAGAAVAAALGLLADDNTRQHMGAAGRAFADAHRGATARLLTHIRTVLPAPEQKAI